MTPAATEILLSSSAVLSSNANTLRRSRSRQISSTTKRQDRQSLPRNQVFSDANAESFLGSSSSSSSNAIQSTLDAPKINSSATKRYVSSFKTLVNSTSGKTNRVNYVNDSVIILKLSKENIAETANGISQISNKQLISTMPTSTTPPPRHLSTSPARFSPVLKVEGHHKRRVALYDSPLIPSNNTDVSVPSNSIHTMTMSATSHPSSNPSLFAYRSTLTAGATVRQRALTDTTTTSLFIATEKLKTNMSSAMRPARQPLTGTTTTVSSAYMPTQPLQRNASQNTKPRTQQDRFNNSKDLYDYPDPFTNCPQDILSRLAQLTKLQLETVEWEKKRRFIKKKPITNNTHGKDSP